MSLYYQDEFVELHHGDCRGIRGWTTADVLVTDPPYGMAYVSRRAKSGPSSAITGDKDTDARDAVLDLWGDKPALVFGKWNVARPAATRHRLIWDKGDDPGSGDLAMPWGNSEEEIYVLGRGFAGKRRSNVIRSNRQTAAGGRRPDHPTPKPVALMEALIEYAPAGVIRRPVRRIRCHPDRRTQTSAAARSASKSRRSIAPLEDERLLRKPADDELAVMDTTTTPLRSGELFAGVGGLGMAVDEVFGSRPEWFAEFDPAPSKVLAHHYPGVPNHGDVTKVFCDGSRELRPESRARSYGAKQHTLRALDAVLADLSGLGFDAEWIGLRAADVGAPHGRFRVFILAWPAERTVPDADREGLGSIGRFVPGGRDADGRRRAHEPRYDAEPPPRLTLLPTPIVTDGTGGSKNIEASDFAPQMRDIAKLLPTPTASEGEKGGPNQAYGSGGATLSGTVPHLLPTPSVANSHGNDHNGRGEALLPGAVRLLPTPMVGSSNPAAHGQISGDFRAAMDEVMQEVTLLPTPNVAMAEGGQTSRSGDRKNEPLLGGIVVEQSANWGAYAPAITRWETEIERTAPAPVRHDGKGGKARLNPGLTEWMMGWPAGWVTDPSIGLTRAEQLKACGNGVVPQQAAFALRTLLARPGVPPIREAVAS